MSITCYQRGLQAADGSIDVLAGWYNLTLALSRRHDLAGEPADLDAAISTARHALAAATSRPPEQGQVWQNAIAFDHGCTSVSVVCAAWFNLPGGVVADPPRPRRRAAPQLAREFTHACTPPDRRAPHRRDAGAKRVAAGRDRHGLPRRLIPLTELSAILMHPRAARPRRTRPGCTVTNARTDPDRWVVEAVGVGFRGRSCLDEAGERCGPGIVRAVWDKGLGVGESLPRFREMASRSRRGHQLSPYLRLGELIRQCTGEWYAAGGDGRHQSGRRLPSPLSSAEGSDECRCPIEESHPLPRRAPP